MNSSAVGRNYAETLLTLAQRANDTAGWGNMIADVAEAMERDETLRRFLESPRVSAQQKNDVLAKAFQDRMPRLLVKFLQALVNNRRQMMIPQIAAEYRDLVDEAEGRVHAQVTVAKQPTEEDRAAITRELSRTLGKQVVPHLTVDASILGGVVVRVGDTVMDGSVRRRLAILRNRLVYGAR